MSIAPYLLISIFYYAKEKAFENSKAVTFLEPTSFSYLIDLVEFFIAFGKVDNSLD